MPVAHGKATVSGSECFKKFDPCDSVHQLLCFMELYPPESLSSLYLKGVVLAVTKYQDGNRIGMHS